MLHSYLHSLSSQASIWNDFVRRFRLVFDGVDEPRRVNLGLEVWLFNTHGSIDDVVLSARTRLFLQGQHDTGLAGLDLLGGLGTQNSKTHGNDEKYRATAHTANSLALSINDGP